jgi:hypothetical protein
MKRDPRLVFYEGEELEHFIESYPLDEEERRFLYKVARHVRRGRVEEKLLEEADVLVRRIRKEREPIQPIPKRVRREPQADYSSFGVLEKLRSRRIYIFWALLSIPIAGLLIYIFLPDRSSQQPDSIFWEGEPIKYDTYSRSTTQEKERSTGKEKRKEKKGSKVHTVHSESPTTIFTHGIHPSDVHDQKIVIKIPLSKLGISEVSGEEKKVCKWKRGVHHYIYEPLEETIREKEDCERVLKGWENWEIRAWRPAKRDGMKLKGTLQVKLPAGKECRLQIYEEPFGRFRIASVDPGAIEACAVYQAERGW